MNRRNWRRFPYFALDVMREAVFVIPGRQSHWMICPICAGNIAVVTNGILGHVFDFTYEAPYWLEDHQKFSDEARLRPSWNQSRPKTFLDEDFCAIEDHDFFVRGIIHLPIIGTSETLRWGVWGSLSHQNFETLLKMNDDAKRVELPPMFSWLSTQIPEYPDTLSLKMYSHIEEVDWRPSFELEPSDHPLSQEYHNGITAERVKQIMMGRLRS